MAGTRRAHRREPTRCTPQREGRGQPTHLRAALRQAQSNAGSCCGAALWAISSRADIHAHCGSRERHISRDCSSSVEMCVREGPPVV